MKAIILAAGVGSRMGDLTMNMPKCLLEINNTPILKKQITSLVENGITDVSVVVGYKSEIVKNLFKESNIKFYTNLNYKKTGMLESLFCAEGELNDEFILVYGDVYFEPKVIKKLLQDENDFCIVVSKPKKMKYESKLYFEDYYGKQLKKSSTKIYVNGTTVEKISKELNQKQVNAEYVGITKFSDRGAKILYDKIKFFIKSGNIVNYPSPSYFIKWLIEAGEKVNAVFIDKKDYTEIDYEEDLKEARKKFNQIKGVIFDAEDVIYFRNERTLNPIFEFFRGNKYNITYFDFLNSYEKDRLDAYEGKITKDEHLKSTLMNLGIDFDELFFERFKNIFRDTYSNVILSDEIISIFKVLKQKKIKIAVLTDTFSTKEEKWKLFKNLGLDKFINIVICSRDIGFTKQHKEAYEITLQMMNLTSKDALFVGHKSYEIEGANKAGLTSISLCKGAGECIYIEDITKLIDLV